MICSASVAKFNYELTGFTARRLANDMCVCVCKMYVCGHVCVVGGSTWEASKVLNADFFFFFPIRLESKQLLGLYTQ